MSMFLFENVKYNLSINEHYLINFPHVNKYSDSSSPLKPNDFKKLGDLEGILSLVSSCGAVSFVSRVPQDITCRFPRE